MSDDTSTPTCNGTAGDLTDIVSPPVATRYQYLFFTAVAIFFILAKSWTAYPLVFPESGNVQLLGVDSYFHLRHAEYSADHFPSKMLFDPGARYPNIGKQQVTGLFNLLIAATALVGSGFSPGPGDVARAAAWAPLLLSLLSLWVLFRLAIFLRGFSAGAFSILVFTLYPGTSATRGMLGFADQHAAEMLFALASVAGLTFCLEHTRRDANLSWKKPAMILALPFAAFFYVWLGTPMYIAIMAISLFALILQQFLLTSDTHRLALGLFRFFSAAAIWQFLVILFWPDILMELIPGMRWWNLGAMIAFASLPSAFLYVSRRSNAAGIARSLFVLIAIITVSIAVFAFFEYTPRGKMFSGWLLRPRNQNISEQQIISLLDFWTSFGTAGLFAAVGIAVALLKKRGAGTASWSILSVVFGASITFIWLRTHDFDYVPPIFIALMAGLAISFLMDWTRRKAILLNRTTSVGLPASLSRAPVIAFTLILVLPIWPLVLTDLPYQSFKQIKQTRLQSDAWFKAMAWMRSRTPDPTILPLTKISSPVPEVHPVGSYGVMTAWDYGNFVATVGHRLPVSSRFPSKKSAKWLTAVSEEEGDSLLCQGCVLPEYVKYVVLDARLASRLFLAKAMAAGRKANIEILGAWNTDVDPVPRVSFGEMYENAMLTRLFVKDGRDLGGYRHIYESSELALIAQRYVPEHTRSGFWSVPIESNEDLEAALTITQRPLTPVENFFLYNARIVPELKMYEVVRGARLVGIVSPGDSVAAYIPLRSMVSRREFSFSNTTLADSSGRFELRLPYSTGEFSHVGSTTLSLGNYRIHIQGKTGVATHELSVTENAVLEGHELTLEKVSLKPN